jgi:hypothetical protein
VRPARSGRITATSASFGQRPGAPAINTHSRGKSYEFFLKVSSSVQDFENLLRLQQNFAGGWAGFLPRAMCDLARNRIKEKSGLYYDEQRRGLKWSHRQPTSMNLQALSDLGQMGHGSRQKQSRIFDK